jgi:hypothetical protein
VDAEMRIRTILSQVLLFTAFVLGPTAPGSMVGASGTEPAPDNRSANCLVADSSGGRVAIAPNAPEEKTRPMVAGGEDHIVGLKPDGTVVAKVSNGWGQCDVGDRDLINLQWRCDNGSDAWPAIIYPQNPNWSGAAISISIGGYALRIGRWPLV